MATRGNFDAAFASLEGQFDRTQRRAAWFDDALVESLHTRSSNPTLPGSDGDLESAFSASDIAAVASDDATRSIQSGTGVYLIEQFKIRNSNNTDAINVGWNGQVSMATSVSTVYLQIYNRNSAAWETLASNSSAAADTDFTLSATQSASLSNYYDSAFLVSFRIYQFISATTPVTWAVTNMVDDGGGTVRQRSTDGYFGQSHTNETLSGDGYFEFTFNGDICNVWLSEGTTYPANTGDGNKAGFLQLRFGSSTSVNALDKANSGPSAFTTAANDVWRMEISGTSLLIKQNGTLKHTFTSQTFTTPVSLGINVQKDSNDRQIKFAAKG
jgi:hypothetical protein